MISMLDTPDRLTVGTPIYLVEGPGAMGYFQEGDPLTAKKAVVTHTHSLGIPFGRIWARLQVPLTPPTHAGIRVFRLPSEVFTVEEVTQALFKAEQFEAVPQSIYGIDSLVDDPRSNGLLAEELGCAIMNRMVDDMTVDWPV